MAIMHTLRQQWIGVLGVVLGVTGVAFGATGQPALLGALNKADKPTAVQNTGPGPAASFKVKAGQPPFAVNSAVQVAKLNAARLGGTLPSAFARAGASYKKAASDSRYIDTTEIGGYYTKTQVNARFAPAAGSTAYLASGVRVLEASHQPDAYAVDIMEGISMTIYDNTFTAPAAGTISVTATGRCYSSDGSLKVKAGAGAPEVVVALAGDIPGLCDATSSVAVAAGAEVAPTVVITTGSRLESTSIQNWNVTVVFTPS